MLLAPARPRAELSQSASRHGFTSQRETDPESALMHFRIRCQGKAPLGWNR